MFYNNPDFWLAPNTQSPLLLLITHGHGVFLPEYTDCIIYRLTSGEGGCQRSWGVLFKNAPFPPPEADPDVVGRFLKEGKNSYYTLYISLISNHNLCYSSNYLHPLFRRHALPPTLTVCRALERQKLQDKCGDN